MLPIRDINPTRITPIITLAIIVVSAWVFFAYQPRGDQAEEIEFAYERAVIACEVTTGEPLSVREINTETCSDAPAADVPFPDKNIWLAGLVSMFLHGGVLHILGNMWFLWIFGNNVEEAFGTLGFLLVYVASGLAATAGFVALNADSTLPLVGASGAVAGVLGAYLVLFPAHQILSLFFVFFIPIPAVVFLGLWFLGQFGINDPFIAWEAHVVGFLFGMLITIPLRGVLLRRVAGLHSTRPERFAA